MSPGRAGALFLTVWGLGWAAASSEGQTVGSTTLQFGAPTAAGNITLAIGGEQGGAVTESFGIVTASIPANATAAQKASLVANAINAKQNAPATASNSGSQVIVNPLAFGVIDTVEITDDRTGESNALSAQPGSGVSLKIEFIPQTQPPATIPPAGTSFFPFVAIGTATTGATMMGNGSLTDPQIQALMFQQFANAGIHFQPATDPLVSQGVYVAALPSSLTGGLQPADAVPLPVSMNWDANTSQYLGNFGLQFQAVPEPAALTSCGVVLFLVRRRSNL